MPATTYANYIGDTVNGNTPEIPQGIIRDWANRDANVLPRTVIERCLEWGADECYRRLRIPTLELTRTFTVELEDIESQFTYRGGQIVTFDVPSDYIELIYIHRPSDYTIYNYRLDNRSIKDSYASIQYNSFTRVGNQFELFGLFNEGDEIEIHYYRRLPALDATYTINAENAAAGLVTVKSGGDPSIYDADNYDTSESPNWLRDENQRILMFGALMEVYNYLDEPESYQKYQQRFIAEIEELNAQERRRDAMGGNVQVSYTSHLL